MSHCWHGCGKDPRVESSGVAEKGGAHSLYPVESVRGNHIIVSAQPLVFVFVFALYCICIVLYCISFHPRELVKRNHIMSQITFSLKGAVWGMVLDQPVCCNIANIVALVILL